MQLSTRITDLLDRVRGRIRRYVWMEGIAVAVIWLVATFWIGLALDYLPVRLGATEMPVAARAVMLATITVALTWILYRWVLRRAFVRLQDRSIAVLIERKFPQLRDSLVTSVELAPPGSSRFVVDGDAESIADEQLHQHLLQESHELALQQIDSIDESVLFDFWPLRRAVAVAGLMLASVVLFGLLAWPAFRLATSRLYGLSDRPYPRRTHLEMMGFEEGVATVARGSNLAIRVRADAKRRVPPPDVCTIYYRTDDGERGRVNMSKTGLPKKGFQQYTFEGKPFKGILDDIYFDVVADDQRVRDQQVRVVESPQVISVSIDCTRPAYTRLDRTMLEYYPGLKIPQGSQLFVHLTTNKPIVRAELSAPDDEVTQRLEPPSDDLTTLVFEVDRLDEDLSREIVLHDVDGVTSQRPYRIAVVAVPDFPPQVEVRMQGIGSAITPDARIPMSGEIRDDYGVGNSWFELQMTNDETREFPLRDQVSGPVELALDLRAQRTKDEDPMELTIDSSVVLSVKSSDEFDLAVVPNVGQSDRYELEVVSANQLIALLEARELGLRRRFEQIILELRETRDSLHRVQFVDAPSDTQSGDSTDLEVVDEDRSSEEDTTQPREQRTRRAAALRLLRVQRGQQHSQRSALEVLGVALSFEDIVLELVNNRVDANDRVEGIERDISVPLHETVEQSYPPLDEKLNRLHVLLDGTRSEDEIASATQLAVDQVDRIVVELEAVLEKMLDLETYNELVDLIRSMMKDQEELTERTKKQRKKSALDLLK